MTDFGGTVPVWKIFRQIVWVLQFSFFPHVHLEDSFERLVDKIMVNPE